MQMEMRLRQNQTTWPVVWNVYVAMISKTTSQKYEASETTLKRTSQMGRNSRPMAASQQHPQGPPLERGQISRPPSWKKIQLLCGRHLVKEAATRPPSWKKQLLGGRHLEKTAAIRPPSWKTQLLWGGHLEKTAAMRPPSWKRQLLKGRHLEKNSRLTQCHESAGYQAAIMTTGRRNRMDSGYAACNVKNISSHCTVQCAVYSTTHQIIIFEDLKTNNFGNNWTKSWKWVSDNICQTLSSNTEYFSRFCPMCRQQYQCCTQMLVQCISKYSIMPLEESIYFLLRETQDFWSVDCTSNPVCLRLIFVCASLTSHIFHDAKRW